MNSQGRLWHHPDFLKLWAGQSVSLVGTAVTMLALPTAAIIVLHASPFQVGLLAAVQRVPFPLLALFAGVWVDRVRRRPLMIAADIGRCLAVASIPIAAVAGSLTLTHLYAVAVVLGCFSVLFDVSYLAYLPALVEPDDLVEGNTKLQLSFSASGLLGPSLAGALIQVFGAARALLADALSYAVSVIALLSIRGRETRGRDVGDSGAGMRRELADGLRLVFRHELLRSLLLTETAATAGLYFALPIMLIFVYQDLHLSPLIVGATSAAEGAAQIAGALLASRCVRWLRLGPTLLLTLALVGLAVMALPAALWLPAVPVLVVVSVVLGMAGVMHDIIQLSLRQGLTPARFQGRMNATFRAFYWGAWPVASLLGGLLATVWGHAQTLVLGGAIALVCTAAMALTPLRRVREQPVAQPDLTSAAAG